MADEARSTFEALKAAVAASKAALAAFEAALLAEYGFPALRDEVRLVRSNLNAVHSNHLGHEEGSLPCLEDALMLLEQEEEHYRLLHNEERNLGVTS